MHCLKVNVHTFLDGVPEPHLLTFKALKNSLTRQKIADELDVVSK